MKLGIVGSGNVGKALGKALTHHGFAVMFYDVDKSQLQPLADDGLTVSTTKADLYACDVLFLCVPSEMRPNGDCDLSIIEDVVSRNLAKFDGIIVQVSTCPPMTARHLGKKTIAEYVVMPSFYSMARMEYDALYPIKILLGTSDGKVNLAVSNIFSRFNAPIFFGTYETVELAKYADNILSALLISYWNEINMIAEKIDVDSDLVARITDTTPLYRSVYRFHGKAFGGACLPKDTIAFINWCKEKLGYSPKMMVALWEVNEEMKSKKGVNERHHVYRT